MHKANTKKQCTVGLSLNITNSNLIKIISKLLSPVANQNQTYVQTAVECSEGRVEQLDHPLHSTAALEYQPTLHNSICQ